MSKITNDGLTRSGTGCIHVTTTASVKEFNVWILWLGVDAAADAVWSRRQAGRYQKALELAERAREIEETELGARRDRMADIYQMCAISMDEVGTAVVTC